MTIPINLSSERSVALATVVSTTSEWHIGDEGRKFKARVQEGKLKKREPGNNYWGFDRHLQHIERVGEVRCGIEWLEKLNRRYPCPQGKLFQKSENTCAFEQPRCFFEYKPSDCRGNFRLITSECGIMSLQGSEKYRT